MYLRLLAGRHAGQVMDVNIRAARVMLADGRAELPDALVKAKVPAKAAAKVPAPDPAASPSVAQVHAVVSDPSKPSPGKQAGHGPAGKAKATHK